MLNRHGCGPEVCKTIIIILCKKTDLKFFLPVKYYQLTLLSIHRVGRPMYILFLLYTLTKSSPHFMVMFWLFKLFNPLTWTSVKNMSALEPMFKVSGTVISLNLELSGLVTPFLYCLMMFTMASKEFAMELRSSFSGVYSLLWLL